MLPQVIHWITQNLTYLAAIAAGLIALIKYLDQRQRELREQRFEQYWRLIDTCVESPMLAKQQIALLLLKRYPEYQNETIEFLTQSKLRSGPWTQQNLSTIDHLLNHFSHTL
jgi:hypothetical protein